MTINGIEYINAPVTFNTVCKLEDMGVSISEMEGHMMSAIRAYVAICMGKSANEAGNEIEKHIVNGGTLNDAVAAFGAEMEKSDFFQALAKNPAKKARVKKVEA